MKPRDKTLPVRGTPSRDTCSKIKKLPLAAAVYFACASIAWAQDAQTTPPPDATTAAKESKTLDTITVTAQKRVENLQKVPISVQVLGEQKLKQQDVLSFTDYAKLLPSLSYGTVGGGVSIEYTSARDLVRSKR